jgi:hypothetical protein
MRELYDYCSHWVKQHILRIDVQLKPYPASPEGFDQPGNMNPQ